LPHEPAPDTDDGEKTPARPLSVGNKSPDTTITEARP
jgi:cytochrome d ubiquinol oxidase subunit I